MTSPRKVSAARMVAAAYDLGEDLPSWFARMVSLFRGHLDEGFGTYGVIARRHPPEPLHLHLDGAHPVNRALVELGPSVGFYRLLPQGFGAGTASSLLGVASHSKIVAPFLGALRAGDTCGLHGSDGTGNVVVVAAPRKTVGPARPSERRLGLTVLPHFCAALRLRRSLTGLSLEAASAEAVFDPNGRCLNAQGMAEPASAREILRQAVLRTVRREHASDEADAPQEALLAGRWSLVDRFESGGRRLIVAYRNPAGVLDPRRLSPRERAVAAGIAQGTSQSALAAELGVSTSTVGTVAASVVAKLGLRSTRELPLFWRDAAGYPVALGRGDLIALHSVLPAAPATLTPAERHILNDVIRGRSNREIATGRRSSVRTVANQLGTLLRKLGVASRAELAARSLDSAE